VFFALVPSENSNNSNLHREITRLMNQYGDDVLRIAYLYVKDYQRAEDIYQEVFLRVYKQYVRFQGRSSEKTWIIRITINLCKDMLRSFWIKRIIPFRKQAEAVPAEGDFTELIAANSEHRQLFQAVMNLEPAYKEVILLYYYQQLQLIPRDYGK
jgi:RNA polymerase sigma-70 factor (ECF subfamily)